MVPLILLDLVYNAWHNVFGVVEVDDTLRGPIAGRDLIRGAAGIIAARIHDQTGFSVSEMVNVVAPRTASAVLVADRIAEPSNDFLSPKRIARIHCFLEL